MNDRMTNRKMRVVGALVGVVMIGGFAVYQIVFHSPQGSTPTSTLAVQTTTGFPSNANSATSNHVVIAQAPSSVEKAAKQIDATVQSLLNSPIAPSMDASGFSQYVYSTAGVTLPRTISGQATMGTQVNDVRLLQDGDLVFFNLSSNQHTPTFDGIYLGDNQFAALTTHGIKSISLNDPYWKGKFLYGRHVAGL